MQVLCFRGLLVQTTFGEPFGSRDVQIAGIATRTQLTNLDLEIVCWDDRVPQPQHLKTLSFLSNLCALKLTGIRCLEGWFPACVPAWGQLQELHISGARFEGEPLRALAALPSLHTLHCGLNLDGAGHLQLASLQHLNHPSIFRATPAQLAGFCTPQLEKVTGLREIELICNDSDQEQMLADIAGAAGGFLQWAPVLWLTGPAEADGDLRHALSALQRWQPVQRGQKCELNVIHWRSVSPEALAQLPPAIQILKWVPHMWTVGSLHLHCARLCLECLCLLLTLHT
jgi:hypothetical protein